MDSQKKKFLFFILAFYLVFVLFFAPEKKPKPLYFTVKGTFSCSPACQNRLKAFRRDTENEEDLLPSSKPLLKVNDLAEIEPQPSAHQRVRMRLGDLIPLKKAANIEEREMMEEQERDPTKPKIKSKEKYLLHEIETPIYGIHVKIELVVEST